VVGILGPLYDLMAVTQHLSEQYYRHRAVTDITHYLGLDGVISKTTVQFQILEF